MQVCNNADEPRVMIHGLRKKEAILFISGPWLTLFSLNHYGHFGHIKVVNSHITNEPYGALSNTYYIDDTRKNSRQWSASTKNYQVRGNGNAKMFAGCRKFYVEAFSNRQAIFHH